MSEGLKSSLTLNPNKKQTTQPSLGVGVVDYKQVGNSNDIIGELSDEQKQAQFNKQHEQYIKMKLNRKKELLKLKRQQFGTSSSEEKQQSSDQEIGQITNVKKAQSKKEKEPQQINSQGNNYEVTLQLKKLKVQTQLCLHSTQFQVNKRQIGYAKIVRVCLFKDQAQKNVKIKVMLFDEEFNLTHPNPNTSVQIFIRMLKLKLACKNILLKPIQRKTSQQDYSSQHKASALAYDKIYKKSQIIGTWQERYIIIKSDGLYSYRALKSNPTMYIALKESKQLQTQFDIYKDLLVVKLIYNNTKTDFGLPTDPELEWVSHFATLITK